MSETETRRQPQRQHLALARLRSVQWVASQPAAKNGYDSIKPLYFTLRKTAILGWFIIIQEMLVVWWWNFLHNLPWPQPALSLIQWADTSAMRLLDYTQLKLEWWWDATGVRLMWLKESLLSALDRYITIIDRYLLRIQDAVIAAFTFILKPVTGVYKLVTAPSKVQKQQQKKTGMKVMVEEGGVLRGADLESDMAEDDDTEDYLSDGSIDSRRLTHNSPKDIQDGHQSTMSTAEGRLREAMYHRVKKELRLMRKNSIRFSYGIVNYAKQVMEPRAQLYADCFQDYYQRWTRDYEMQEVMTPLQEEWNEKGSLGKALVLARALCVISLASLLRLVKRKKSRRTRSMRSESLRRRAQNLACTTNPLPLSPSALQQSSEPAPSPPLEVPGSLQEAALKEEDEDLDGSQAKDSALGSELDNPSDHQDSDHAIPTIAEEHVSDQDSRTHKTDKQRIENADTRGSPINETRPECAEEEQETSRQSKKGVTIISPRSQKNQKRSNKTPNKKNILLHSGASYDG